MAVYAVGDLQGCHEAFLRLLDKLKFDPGADQLWLVGDLVNRGGESLEVLREVIRLGDAVSCVLGNHDLHLLAMAAGNPRRKPNDELEQVLSAPDSDELLHWLRHRPLLHHDATLGYTMVHAGIEPRWSLKQARSYAGELETVLRSDQHGQFFSRMYGDQPQRWRKSLTGFARLRMITNVFTRMRFIDRKSRELDMDNSGPPGSQPSGLIPWFAWPDRAMAGQTILFGHWSALGAYIGADVIGLDSGYVWGNSLTALRLDKKKRKFLQVHSGRRL